MDNKMKGLSQFFMDLRNSKDVYEENKRINLEINNIQTKFNSSVNGYNRKKYICKLIYIYLLGFTEVRELCIRESEKLVESSVYSEKKMGYLAMSLLLSQDSGEQLKHHLNNVLDKMHPYIVRDLKCNDDDINCLVIEYIGSQFNVSNSDVLTSPIIKESDELSSEWLDIIDILFAFCCSPIQGALVKKKSALSLLTLLKVYPQAILSNNNWIPRLLSLIDDDDLGVVTAASPLISFLIEIKPQFVKSVIPPISNRLYRLIVENDCPDTYYYYKTPAPWLITKLLLLIENFFLLTKIDSLNNRVPILQISDIDTQSLNNLRQVVAKSIKNASQKITGLQTRNSQSAILFQVVSLAVFLDASREAIDGAIEALVVLLDAKETNTRYLALDALIKLIARSSSTHDGLPSPVSKRFEQYTLKVIELLFDKDISVKRKTLDLLYTVCNSETYDTTIQKLIDYFPLADHSLKSEIAVKIAVLAEKFATSSTWYIETMLKLLSLGGANFNGSNYIGNEVWERIVQIIVNNESLQEQSCKSIIVLLADLLKKPITLNSKNMLENLIKVAAFVLGEYGQILHKQNIENMGASVQFQILYEAYFYVSLVCRAMLLSTFFKYAMKYVDEDFVPNIIDLLESETHSMDMEIQTRATEYLKLVTQEENSVLAHALMKPLPVFEQKESPLMARIGSVQTITKSRARSTSSVNVHKINERTVASNKLQPNSKGFRSSLYQQTSNVNSCSSTDLLPPSRDETKANGNFTDEGDDPFTENIDSKSSQLSPDWYSGFQRLRHYNAGIFYENQFIKIIYRIKKDNHVLSYFFTIINNASKTAGTNITKFSLLNLESMTKKEDPNYILSVKQLPALTITDKTTMEIEAKIRNIVEDFESPVISLAFACGGSFNQLTLKFPVILLKTLSPTSASNLEDFKQRWLQIGELLGLEEGECVVNATASHRHNSSNLVRLFSRLGFVVVFSTPDDTDTGILIMGAGILHTLKSNYGVLTTIKCLDAVNKTFTVAVRCTGGGIPAIIAFSIKDIIEDKSSM